MRLLVILLLCLSFTSSSLYAVGRFSVAPGILHFNLDRPKTEVFAVMNIGDERMRIIMQPIYFPVNSRFLSRGEPLVEGQKIKDDITSYLVISPKVVSLKPGEQRSIRVAVQGFKRPGSGDYRGHILVRQLGRAKSASPAKLKKGLKLQINIKQETGIAVYGHKGKPDTKLTVSCNKNDKKELEVTIRNESKFLYMGWLNLADVDQKAKPVQIRLQSYRETKRVYRLQSPFPEKINITWGISKALNEGSFLCTVPKA